MLWSGVIFTTQEPTLAPSFLVLKGKKGTKVTLLPPSITTATTQKPFKGSAHEKEQLKSPNPGATQAGSCVWGLLPWAGDHGACSPPDCAAQTWRGPSQSLVCETGRRQALSSSLMAVRCNGSERQGGVLQTVFHKKARELSPALGTGWQRT